MPRVSLSYFSQIVCVLLMAAGAVRADTAADAYRSAVPVAEQSPAELKRAAAAGMSEVLVGVSGRPDVPTAPALRQPLADAERYIEQYRYERNADGGTLLQMTFAPATINALLRNAGLLDHAAVATTRQGLQLRVEGIESFADYAALLSYLNGAGAVTAAPQTVEGNVVVLSLQTGNGAEQLRQRLTADRRLLPEPAAASDSESLLRYRWQRLGG